MERELSVHFTRITIQILPSLLLLHQWQSDRHSYDEFAKRMQANGFTVLSIDGRGFGESTKKADGTNVTAGRSDADVKAMLGDVGAAIDFLKKQKNVDASKIGIVGASYGSSLAIIYAADHPDVKAVALLSPGLNYFGNMPIGPAVEKYNENDLLLIAADDDKESADAVRKLTSEKSILDEARKSIQAVVMELPCSKWEPAMNWKGSLPKHYEKNKGMSELSDLYQETILEHNKNPRNFREIEGADANRGWKQSVVR
jgi:pimeloyl-ACP methyl ester carboxylesterase